MRIEREYLLPAVAMLIMLLIIVIAYTGISFVTPHFTLTSTAFANNGMIPAAFTCDADGKSPPLSFSNVPRNTRNIVLVVQDLDSPRTTFVHWVMYGIDPTTKTIDAGSPPEGIEQGLNSSNKVGFAPFCPDKGTHRYQFTAYAASQAYHFVNPPTLEQLKNVMKWQVLEKAELTAKYTRAPKA
jgi:Raf kinase inhibitor-like YbhB/YbcL family protein